MPEGYSGVIGCYFFALSRSALFVDLGAKIDLPEAHGGRGRPARAENTAPRCFWGVMIFSDVFDLFSRIFSRVFMGFHGFSWVLLLSLSVEAL